MSVETDQVLAEIAVMIRAIITDFDEDMEITADTAFADLGMESLAMVALAGRVHARYGERVNFAEFVANISAETVNELRIGQVAGYIVDSAREEVTAP
jgi:acyl carrier protein